MSAAIEASFGAMLESGNGLSISGGDERQNSGGDSGGEVVELPMVATSGN